MGTTILLLVTSRFDFVLASTSPRRRELLSGLGFSFEVLSLGVDELDESSRGVRWHEPDELATQNAVMKAEATSERRPGDLVIGADTVVELDSKIFGKPRDLDQAREFLSLLSGRTHRVITGVALIGPRIVKQFFEVTDVRFRALSETMIENYINRIHVLDKAGAYAAQEGGEEIIEKIDGSISNVIGLPTERLLEELRLLGISPRSQAE